MSGTQNPAGAEMPANTAESPVSDEGAGTGENAAATEANDNGKAAPASAPAEGQKDDAADSGNAAEKTGEPDKKAGAGGDGDPGQEWRDLAAHLPENADIDPAIVEDFTKIASSMNLDPEQGRKLIDWQLNAVRQAQEKMKADGLKNLEKDWGRNLESNLNKALGVVSLVDRKLDGKFSASIARFGIANDEAFARGLYAIAQMLGEDSIGVSSGAPEPEKPETALEGLQKIFGKGK